MSKYAGLNVTCPPQACVFEYMVPSWGCCLGKLQNLWGGTSLVEAGHWGWTFEAYSSISPDLLHR